MKKFFDFLSSIIFVFFILCLAVILTAGIGCAILAALFGNTIGVALIGTFDILLIITIIAFVMKEDKEE